MVIQKFETWWVERDQCLFDEKRQGGAKMGWDVIALKAYHRYGNRRDRHLYGGKKRRGE